MKRSEFLAATSTSIFSASSADGFAIAFSLSNHPLSSDLPSSFASYGPSHFNTLHNALMEKANSSGNRRDLLAAFRACISILQEKLKTASGADKKDLLRQLSTYNASASWISLATGDPTASYAHVNEATKIATELNIPWLKSYILCRRVVLALREKNWKDATIFAEAAQKSGKTMDIHLHVYSLLLKAEGYSLLRDKANCYKTLEEAYDLADTFSNYDRPKSEVANFCTHSYIRSATGMCEMYLDPQRSISTFAASFENWPSQFEQQSGFLLAKGALAQIFVRDPEQASLWATQSFIIAQKTGNTLVLRDLQSLDKRMQSERTWRELEPVAGFHEALRSHPTEI